MQNNLLIIFSKVSSVGKVKTRLGKHLGTDKALEIHDRIFTHTLGVASKSSIPFIIYLNEQAVKPVSFDYKIQHGNSLGDKMYNSFEEELSVAEKVCIIGSDCLELNIEDLNSAFQQLSNHDVVLGPANDGGYYLIGLKNPYFNLFTDISWGSASVLKDTIERCNENNLTYHLLEPHNDIDRPEDVPTDWL